ncbi:hypothetical protein ACLB1G_01560 [Oxalobacteraceae bacterium A2-2]
MFKGHDDIRRYLQLARTLCHGQCRGSELRPDLDMSCGPHTFILLVWLVIVVIFATPYHGRFTLYCERRASLEGRSLEFYSGVSIDGGDNLYMIEQAGKLWKRDYVKFNDKQLSELGDKLYRDGGFLLLLVAAAVVISCFTANSCS